MVEQGRAAEGRGSEALRNGIHTKHDSKGIMQIKIFTVPLFGNEEAVEEMNKFLRGNKVVDITKSIVQQGDLADARTKAPFFLRPTKETRYIMGDAISRLYKAKSWIK